MVEVAIALAVIGFALVAIIGILPAGLNVQRENREETIINQDASIWMNAIRQGAEGLDYLVDYVDLIEVTVVQYSSGVPPTEVGRNTADYTPIASDPALRITNGVVITGLLSTPKYRPVPGGGFYSNHVVAYVRSVSGSATEASPQDNPTVREGAFAYRLTSEVIPFYAHDDRWYDYPEFQGVAAGGGADPSVAYARNLANNLHDVRLRFEWPLRPPLNALGVATSVGNGRQSFRSLTAGVLTQSTERPGFWRLQPGKFEKHRGQ